MLIRVPLCYREGLVCLFYLTGCPSFIWILLLLFLHLLQKGGYLPLMLFKKCLRINGFQSDCALPSAEWSKVTCRVNILTDRCFSEQIYQC